MHFHAIDVLWSIAGAGFSARHFCVLAAIIPIHDDDTPDALQARANSAGMLSDFIALRKEHRSDGLRLLGRLRALRLRERVSDGCLVCPAEDDSGEVLLLPDEAFGVTIDMVALEVFAKRDVRRSLNAEEVLREMSSTCLAGGKNFGAVHLRQVQARLLPLPSDGDVGSAASAVETVPSLAALLYRIASDYDNLSTVHGVSRNIIKALPGLRP